MFVLTITPLYAGVLALIYVGLSFFVIRQRYRFRVGLGDGGQVKLRTAIRIHGNFAEFVPLALVLLLINEMAGAAPLALHAMGAGLVVGRVLHAWGLSTSAEASFGRGAGMILTLSVVIGGALLCLSHLWS